MKNTIKKKIRIPLGTFITLFLLLFFWGVVMMIPQENPINAFYQLIKGAFGSLDRIFSIGNLLFIMIFTALAYSIPSWTGMYNIGGDGQLVLGGFFAALVPLYIHTDIKVINISLTLGIAALFGGLWALWPAILKVKFNINEIVTTLLSNYIIIFFSEYLVNYPFRSPGATLVARMEYIPLSFQLPHIGNSMLSSSVPIVLIFLSFVEVFRRFFVYGFQFKVTGSNVLFALQGGINVNAIKTWSMFIGGAFAGLAGGLIVLAMNYTFTAGFSAGFGYTGLLIALIARELPLLILMISIIFGSLQIGAINMQVFTKIPPEITGVLQSIIVFFVAAHKTIGNISVKRKMS
ncbi:MAG: ABC transporter permease [Candidatus Methanofastidiosa archaeon]|nr:ABC transporter permease [Candidatus Methanofastidiosa archaeon]